MAACTETISLITFNQGNYCFDWNISLLLLLLPKLNGFIVELLLLSTDTRRIYSHHPTKYISDIPKTKPPPHNNLNPFYPFATALPGTPLPYKLVCRLHETQEHTHQVTEFLAFATYCIEPDNGHVPVAFDAVQVVNGIHLPLPPHRS